MSRYWDGENRLTQCVYGGVTTTHTYGADGFRHRTVNGSNTTDFVLDGPNAVRTFLNSSVDKTYLHGPRGPEYERTGSSNPVWYLYDGLGSVLGTVDSSGTVVNTRKYDVYGTVRGSTGGSGPKHKFVGALGHPSDDETGLVYMRARYYDPITGRFLGEDPARVGTNWLSYALDAPTIYRDSSGQSPESELFALFLLGLADVLLQHAQQVDKVARQWIVNGEIYQLQALADPDPASRQFLRNMANNCFNMAFKLEGRALTEYFASEALREFAYLVLATDP